MHSLKKIDRLEVPSTETKPNPTQDLTLSNYSLACIIRNRKLVTGNVIMNLCYSKCSFLMKLAFSI